MYFSGIHAAKKKKKNQLTLFSHNNFATTEHVYTHSSGYTVTRKDYDGRGGSVMLALRLI